MARKPSELNIPDIAREAGVSASTVSRVINRRSGVGEATRKAITEILHQRGFKPTYPMMRTAKVAVAFPWPNFTEYFQKTMGGIYSYAMNHQLVINTVIAGFNKKESLLEIIREQQCAGVIALLSEHYYQELQKVINSDLPVVLIDATAQDPRVGFIDNDSYSGSCEATKYLIENGHKKIGYLTYDDMSLNQLQRYKGYVNTLNNHDIPLNEDYVIKASYPSEIQAKKTHPILPEDEMFSFDVRGDIGYFTMKKYLKNPREFTALMAVDDSMALGAIAAIHEAGLKIPDDISVVGFDNYSDTKYWFPSLTTVDHPLEGAGYLAIKAIHDAVGKVSGWQPPREILSTKLIIRNSASAAMY